MLVLWVCPGNQPKFEAACLGRLGSMVSPNETWMVISRHLSSTYCRYVEDQITDGDLTLGEAPRLQLLALQAARSIFYVP